MTPCPSCGRHVIHADAGCPFCGAPTLGRRALQIATAVFTPVFLAACYGTSGFDDSYKTTDTTGTDADADGYPVSTDCDDAEPAINPGAAEVCDDGIDNDCDTNTDSADTDCP